MRTSAGNTQLLYRAAVRYRLDNIECKKYIEFHKRAKALVSYADCLVTTIYQAPSSIQARRTFALSASSAMPSEITSAHYFCPPHSNHHDLSIDPLY
jgi:hypothetical protein